MKFSNAVFLTELGQWGKALRTFDEVLRWEGSSEDPHLLVGALCAKARIALLRGQLFEAVPLKEQFLPLARQINESDYLGQALVVAALIEQAEGLKSEPVALIDEYAQATKSSARSRLYLQLFTDALRVLVRSGGIALAEALLAEEEARAAGVRATNSILTGKAILAEARSEFLEAIPFYLEAANRWAAFGQMLERGQTLLGAGRCLLAVSRGAEAQEPLRQARGNFFSLGARPALAEADRLLQQAMASAHRK
jgi:tetratricopeptide (TPR) repeat protein